MAKAKGDGIEQLLLRGQQIIEQLNADISVDTSFQSLKIEKWLADIGAYAEFTQSETSLEKLQVIVNTVNLATSNAKKRSKEQLLKSKRVSKGKLAYQQQK